MQMPEDDREREGAALEAPPELISALKRSPRPSIFIPPAVDEAILHAAHQHLSRKKSPRLKWFLPIPWGVAVAVLVLLLVIAPQALRKAGSTPGSRFVRDDLNRDGQVNILDAFALARELKTGVPLSPQLDINGDGVVDERDVATLAARAVSLGKGGGS